MDELSRFAGGTKLQRGGGHCAKRTEIRLKKIGRNWVKLNVDKYGDGIESAEWVGPGLAAFLMSSSS